MKNSPHTWMLCLCVKQLLKWMMWVSTISPLWNRSFSNPVWLFMSQAFSMVGTIILNVQDLSLCLCVYVFVCVVNPELYLESHHLKIWHTIKSRLSCKGLGCLHVRLNALELIQWWIYSIKKQDKFYEQKSQDIVSLPVHNFKVFSTSMSLFVNVRLCQKPQKL